MPQNTSLIEQPNDRELVFTRTFDAPCALVWRVHTEPNHVAQWWGPKGFTNTIHEMDVRVGGVWRLTMHGPDGKDYPNRMEFLEVVPGERLVYWHGDDTNAQMFHVVTRFIAEGGRTTIVSRITFRTAGECEAIKGFASEGHNSTWDRLAEKLAALVGAEREIVGSRVFPWSREAMFAAFADPVRLAQWWGPNGFTNTFHTFDLRVGGGWKLTMHGPDGSHYENEKTFTEVVRPERVVSCHGQPGHEFQMTMLYTVEAEGTRLTWRMLFDSAEECARVRDFILVANEQNFDRLAAHLAATAGKEKS